MAYKHEINSRVLVVCVVVKRQKFDIYLKKIKRHLASFVMRVKLGYKSDFIAVKLDKLFLHLCIYFKRSQPVKIKMIK